MKPDWSEAPEWANYVAMDADGEWFWYADKPCIANSAWLPDKGRWEPFEVYHDDWRKTLEPRP